MSKPYVVTQSATFGRGRTSRKKAREYVSRGRARWDGAVLVFIEDSGDYRQTSVAATRHIYLNGAGFASLKGLQGTPVVNPIALLTGKRPAESPRDWPDPVVLSVRPLTPADASFRSVRPAKAQRTGGNQLMSAGKWLVPEDSRPAGWEQMAS